MVEHLLEHPSAGAVRRPARWWSAAAAPWRSRAGVVAIALIVVQAVWRGVLLGRGFFTQDDYLMLRLGAEPLSSDLLLQDYSGHLFPGGFLLAWGHSHFAPLDWSVAVVEILLLQAIAAALAWLVLGRLLPGSWARVPLLAVALFCPLALWPTQWWCVSIQFLPVSIALLLAAWALLVHLQDGVGWAAVLVVVATVGGLLFQERAMLFPLVLGLVAVAHSTVPGPRAVLDALRAHLRLWVALGVVVGAYLLVHRALAPIATTSAGNGGDGAELVGNFLGRNAVPGFVGGPWDPTVTGDSLLVPPTYAVVLAWLVVLAGVAWSLRRNRAAAWGWLLLLVYVLVDAALLFGGRTAMGPTFGLIPRYAADIVPVLPIALGLVVRAALARPVGTAGPSGPSGTRRPVLVAGGLTLAYLASAAVTTGAVASYSYNNADRQFVETLRGELRTHPRVVLFDAGAPDDLMIGWFGSDARISTLVGTAPESPVFDRPSHAMRMVDAEGRLRAIDLVSTVSMRSAPDATCGYPVRAEATSIPLKEEVSGERMVARVSYYTASSGTLEVRTDESGDTDRVALRQDLNTVDLVVSGDLDELTMSLDEQFGDGSDEPGTVCVVGVRVGFPVARSGS